MTLAAVADTGPLIHIAESESLGVLSVFDDLIVPEIVIEELEAGGVPHGQDEHSVERVEPVAAQMNASQLDPGESAALSVARELGVVLLTDTLAAREAAASAGVEVHGSMGVIALGVDLDREDAARRMRALQREASLFMTDAIVE